jgi:hypothetical protein
MAQRDTRPSVVTLPFDLDVFLDKWKFGWASKSKENEERERDAMCRDMLFLIGRAREAGPGLGAENESRSGHVARGSQGRRPKAGDPD